ncbi:MAG: LysR family transcriptional regulator [Paracoccaceae bacterium]|nr:MAG: LysR family transcriptional regulator [Paracoccaceae bacterium]
MLDRLEMFVELAREGHFGRAAIACGVAQPTLSSAIRALEDQLGVQLVVRGSRYRGLTPEGERALLWARRILADARAMKEEARAARSGLSGLLRLSVIPTALPMATRLTLPFAERHPQVRLRILSRTSVQILADLADGSADAGVTYLDNEPLGRVAQVPLYTEFYRFLCHADHPLAASRRVTWAEVAGQSLCLLTGEMQNRRIVDTLLSDAGFVAGAGGTAGVESNSTMALVTHVRSGRWSSVVPQSLAAMFTGGGDLRAVPIVDPEAEHLVGLVTLPRDPAIPMVKALVDVAQKVAGG